MMWIAGVKREATQSLILRLPLEVREPIDREVLWDRVSHCT